MFNSYNNKPENSLNFHNKWKNLFVGSAKSWKLHHMTIFFLHLIKFFIPAVKNLIIEKFFERRMWAREREFHSKWIISASFISLNERVCVCVCLPSCSQLLRFLIRRFAWACVGVKFLPFFLQNTANERVFYALSLVVVSNSLLALSLFLLLHSHAAMPMWLIVIFSFLFLSPSKFIFFICFPFSWWWST